MISEIPTRDVFPMKCGGLCSGVNLCYARLEALWVTDHSVIVSFIETWLDFVQNSLVRNREAG